MTRTSSIVSLFLASADKLGATCFPRREPVLWSQAKVSFLRIPVLPGLGRSGASESKVRFLRNGCPWLVWNGKSEVFTHCGLDLLRKTKKSFGCESEVSTRRVSFPDLSECMSKSELFTQLAQLVARACTSSLCTDIGTHKSEVSTHNKVASLDAQFARLKVRFLRILEVVTPCTFVIYKKVSQAY